MFQGNMINGIVCLYERKKNNDNIIKKRETPNMVAIDT